jgi:hypothetical protein
MFTTADVNIHALIAKYGIDIQIVRPENYNKFLSPTSILECNSHKIKIHVY